MTSHIDAVIVGSGPGGAVTARVLAEAGLRTLLIEEGPAVEAGSIAPFSREQMRRQYRNEGLTVALGRPAIAYTEARCLGGGSEVNSGLYHRPPAEVLDEWSQAFAVDSLTPDDLLPFQERLEAEISVQPRPAELVPESSRLLRCGAEALGWRGVEVPQWSATTPPDPPESTRPGWRRQTMSRTYLPAAVEAGCELWTNCRVERVRVAGSRARGVCVLATLDGRTERREVDAEAVVVCAGAIQTPALLQRSGVRAHIGANLSVHPTVKVVAEYDEDVNDPADLADYQVKEFGSWLSFGGSAATPALLALAHVESGLADDPRGELGERMTRWRRQLVFYAAIQSEGRGRVRALPRLHDPLVTYRLTGRDRRLLEAAQSRLVHLALATGARTVYPTFPGARPVRDKAEAVRSLAAFRAQAASLMTVHLAGTVPLGEDRSRCGADVRTGARIGQPVRERRVPAAVGARRESAGIGHGAGAPQRGADRRGPMGAGRVTTLLDPPEVTILTGASGWFGRAFLSALSRDDPGLGPVRRTGEVRVLVAAPADVDAVLEVLPSARVFVGDVSDVSQLTALFARADGASVVHAAAVIHPRRGADFERVNAGGTANVVDQARRAGVRRLVHISSNSPFGTNPSPDDTFRHDEPYRPGPGYGMSKMHAEELVRAAHDPDGARTGRRFDTVVVRPPWFYGPWQPARQTTFFTMVRSGRFPLLGDGSQRRSMVYVDNLVQAVALAERVPQASGGTFWAADARPYPMSEVVSTVRRALVDEGYPVAARQRRLPAVIGRVAEHADRILQSRGLYRQEVHVLGEMDKTIACDIEHSVEVLGYRPQVELLEGMRRSIRWLRERGVEL